MTQIVGTLDGGEDNIFDSTALQILGASTSSVHNAKKVVLDVPMGGGTLTLTGTGFGGFDSDGIPTTGTVTGLSGALIGAWSHFGSISAASLFAMLKDGDATGFNNTFFGGNDVFVGHDTSTSASQEVVYSGYGGNDQFNMTHAVTGSYATIDGGTGNDVIDFVDNYDPATNTIDGGDGTDVLKLDGSYAGLIFQNTSLANIDRVLLTAGHHYAITTDDANVDAGKVLSFNGAALGSGDTLNFNGAAETNGRFIVAGGAGKDTLDTGAGSDKIQGGAGADHIDAGTGHNIFIYKAVQDSLGSPNGGPTGTGYDTITGANIAVDKFDLWFAVTGVDTTVASGQLRQVFFDDDMSAALDAAHLSVHHAVLFTPTTGDLAGRTYLVVEANGTAGYQSAGDLVIQLDSATHLASLAPGNFI